MRFLRRNSSAHIRAGAPEPAIEMGTFQLLQGTVLFLWSLSPERWHLTAPAWIKFLGLHGPAMELSVSHQGRFKPGGQRSLRMQTADSCSSHTNWREICPHLNCSH